METPNLIESLEPCSGRYSPRKDLHLNLWLAVAAVTYCGALLVAKRHPDWSPEARAALALTPLIPGFFYVRRWLRFVRGLDELQRRIQLEAFLYSTLGTLLVETVVNVLGTNGVAPDLIGHGLGVGGVFMVMYPLWLVGGAIGNRRYQ